MAQETHAAHRSTFLRDDADVLDGDVLAAAHSRHFGRDEQMFGAKQQVPREEQSYLRMRRLDAGYLDEQV